jgi:hypothetical protein
MITYGALAGIFRSSWVAELKTEQIRDKFQRVYADIIMIERLLDLIDKGRDDPEIWRAADNLMLDMVSILNSVAEEIESHYSE